MEALSVADINKEYHTDLNYDRVDGLLVKILWWHFAAILIGALATYYLKPITFLPSSFSWHELTRGEVVGSIAIAFLAALVPTLLRGRFSNHYHYRLIMVAAYMTFSFLIILVGSSTEMHFYLFGIWALLTFYGDWRLVWIGFALMVVHHVILNFTVPDWLYQYGRNDIALLIYIILSLPAAIFTAKIAGNIRQAVVSIAEANKYIQSRVN